MTINTEDVVKIWIDGKCYDVDKRELANFYNNVETIENQIRIVLDDDKTIEIDKEVFDNYEPHLLYKSLKDSIDLGTHIWKLLISTDEKYTSIYKKDSITYLCEDGKAVAKFDDSNQIFKDLEENRIYNILREEFAVVYK